MTLGLEITRAWETLNAAGGSTAQALQAIRDCESPDELSNALGLLEEAKRHTIRAVGQLQLQMDTISKKLATC